MATRNVENEIKNYYIDESDRRAENLDRELGLYHHDVKKKPRHVFVMRHGERVDMIYRNWVNYCFDDQDNYSRKDFNLPIKLPNRTAGSNAYAADTPLTVLGLMQARSIGEGLKEAGVTLSHVYCSPALRSVQTAQAMLDGYDAPRDSLKIRLEPALFEWLVWYPSGSPLWMTPEELLAADYNIDMNYTPFIGVNDPPFRPKPENFQNFENFVQFHRRHRQFTTKALQQTEKEGGDVMFVGHAITLDTIWRELAESRPRDLESLLKILAEIPYCSLVAAKGGPKWELIAPPCAPMMNTENKKFNWKVILNE